MLSVCAAVSGQTGRRHYQQPVFELPTFRKEQPANEESSDQAGTQLLKEAPSKQSCPTQAGRMLRDILRTEIYTKLFSAAALLAGGSIRRVTTLLWWG